MKVKLFSGEYYKPLEEEINKFLKDEKIAVKYIKQTAMIGTICGIFISIFYEEKKENNDKMSPNEPAPWA